MKEQNHTAVPFFFVLVLAVCIFTLSSCGGGSSGGDDSGGGSGTTSFSGSLTTAAASFSARAANPVVGATVGALGVSSATDAQGSWRFNVAASTLPAGDILFEILGAGVDTSVIVPALPAATETVTVDIVLDADGEASLDGLVIDGIPSTTPTPEPTPTATPAPEDDACSIINRVNVTFLDAVQRIEVPEKTADCEADRAIDNLLTMGNPGDFDYAYLLSASPDYIIYGDDVDGTLEAGKSIMIDGDLDCDAVLAGVPLETEGVTFDMTVQLLSITLEDGTVRDTAELVAECGAGASVGNLAETVSVEVFKFAQGG